jgi:hypothetical protein
MVRQAVSVELAAEPSEFKPGQNVKFNLRFKNSGAGHKIPTGDPDRYFTVTFTVKDQQGRVVSAQDDTMGRWIMWKPIIVELYDNRVGPQQVRDYSFNAKIPGDGNLQTLHVQVQYHILTEKAYKRLQARYGLTQEVPHVFTIYEKEISLSENSAWLETKGETIETFKGCAG